MPLPHAVIPDCSRVFSPLLHAAAKGCTGRTFDAACGCLRHLVLAFLHSSIVSSDADCFGMDLEAK